MEHTLLDGGEPSHPSSSPWLARRSEDIEDDLVVIDDALDAISGRRSPPLSSSYAALHHQGRRELPQYVASNPLLVGILADADVAGALRALRDDLQTSLRDAQDVDKHAERSRDDAAASSSRPSPRAASAAFGERVASIILKPYGGHQTPRDDHAISPAKRRGSHLPDDHMPLPAVLSSGVRHRQRRPKQRTDPSGPVGLPVTLGRALPAFYESRPRRAHRPKALTGSSVPSAVRLSTPTPCSVKRPAAALSVIVNSPPAALFQQARRAQWTPLPSREGPRDSDRRCRNGQSGAYSYDAVAGALQIQNLRAELDVLRCMALQESPRGRRLCIAATRRAVVPVRSGSTAPSTISSPYQRTLITQKRRHC